MGSLSDITTKQENTVEFSFREFFKTCLSKWPWFVGSMVLFLGLAALYIMRQQPVYERSEEILIKDQDAGGGVGEIASAFSSFGLVSSSSSVNNELISLQSPAVMYEVVRRLRLDMDFNKRGDFHPVTLYGDNLPVNVEMQDIGEQESASFRMELRPDGGMRLWKFVKREEDGKIKYKDEIEVRKGKELVKTPLGVIRITANAGYSGKSIEEPIEISVTKLPMQSTVEYYCNQLNSSVIDREADVIGMSIRDVSVQRAVDILNTVLVVYNEEWVKDKNKLAVATSSFINERLNVIQQELGDVDSNIANYMAKTGTPDFMATTQISLEKSGELDAQILALGNNLSMSQYMKDYLANKSNKFNILPANMGIGSESVEKQISEYNTMLLARNNMIDNSSEANPLVQDYDKNLAAMRESIVKGLDNQIENLKIQLRNVRKELGNTEGKIAHTPTKALPLLSEERQQKVKESLYLYLLQKREENELSQKFTADNTRVITPPMGSLKPVSPRKMLIMICAFLAALIVPMVIIYIIVMGDTKVRSKKDLDVVKMPFAGEIPQVGKKPRFKKDGGKKLKGHKTEEAPMAVVEEGNRDVVNEAFRVIRSNLDFMRGKDSKCQVVMITSFNPGSGKSFISYNLGVSFALKHKKVLLIDCDLRHGSSSMYVGMPSTGLANYLTESTDDWKDMVVKTKYNPDLSILPIGKMPPNPAELLENGRLLDLINKAKPDYDYIFLDCPPVNIVVDTQIVGQYADRTLFVVRAGLFEKGALGELNEFYEEKKFKNISLILNGTEAVHSRYYTYGNYQNYQ